MTPDPRGAGFDPARLTRIETALGALVEAGRLPGAVWHVERHGRVAARGAVGFRDPAAAAPMGDDAIFRIHSMTKPITSAAALQLVEAGRLRLDLPVAAYLPEFGAVQVLVEGDDGESLVAPRRPPTVHDLLRHTAGLTYEFHPASAVRRRYLEARLADETRDNAALAVAIAALPLQHEPGRGFEYSRATDVLGRVVEVVAGAPLGRVLDDAILAPLGMADTGFHVPEAAHGRIAAAFSRDPDSGDTVALRDVRRAAALESGGGGLVSTIDDYARFVRMLLAGGVLDGVRLLGRKTVEWMTSDHLDGRPVLCGSMSPGYGFGLGVAVRLVDGVSPLPGSAGGWGWGGSAGTLFFVDPREAMFAVLMTQAPMQRDELQQLFRQLVHAAID